MVTLGTGIGGGIVVDGRVQVGLGRASPARSATWWSTRPGPPCPCGRRGCWERYASGAGLGVLAREAALAGRLDEVVQRWPAATPRASGARTCRPPPPAGDPAARQVIEEVGWWVGFGLANLACVLDPECFVLGGGVVQAGDLLVDAARATFAELVEGGDRRPRRRRSCRPPSASGPARWARRSAARQGGLVVIRDRRRAPRRSATRPTTRSTPRRRRWPPASTALFCYDHIWPMGQPERPALAPVPDPRRAGAPGRSADAARAAARSSARWWRGSAWCPTRCWPRSSPPSSRLAPGPGDRRARHGRPAERGGEPRLRDPLRAGGRAPRRAGRRWPATWSARGSRSGWPAGAPARTEEARAAGAALNVWDADPALGGRAGGAGPTALEVTWAGPPPAAAPTAGRDACRRSHDAGASWAVFGWPVDVDELVAAARAASVRAIVR